MDTGTIPRSLKITRTAPRAIKAFRRQFRSPATNVSAAGPNETVDIYPDTGTPGSFIDPSTTYLSFDFRIENDNFMLDYAHFGPEGVGGAIIQDWRVYNQGSILEEILEYGTAAALLAAVEASYQEEVSLFFSNKLKDRHMDVHKNFIKPPMCNAEGDIIGARNPFGLGYQAHLLKEGGYTTSGAATFIASNTYIGSGKFVHIPGLINAPTSQKHMPYTNYADTVYAPLVDRVERTPLCPTPMDWPDFYSSDQSEVQKRDFVMAMGSVNKAQLMANLCNVKCVPIGMIPGGDCYSTTNTYGAPVDTMYSGAGDATEVGEKKNLPVKKVFKHRICYQPLSGIYGKMASKMIATMLMGPQQSYISIRLASVAVALKTASDPCRRLANTPRDYIRNVGTKNGAVYGKRGTYANTATADENVPGLWTTNDSYAVGYGPPYSINIRGGDTLDRSIPGSVFCDAACNGQVNYNSNQNGQIVALHEAPIPPTPQYMLTKDAWKYKRVQVLGGGSTPVINYATDREVFYGTHLEASVPQSKRMLQFNTQGTEVATFNGNSPSYGFIGDNLTYKIDNIALVGDQIIVPSEVAADVVNSASEGQYHVSTKSVRTYNVSVQRGATQSMILPLKVAKAQQIFCVFQSQEQRNTATGLYYNSNCGYNPFALIDKGDSNTNKSINGYVSGSIAVAPLYGVGFTNPLEFMPTQMGSTQFSVQLRIGSEFFPQLPTTTLSELSAEYVKALQGWNAPSFSPEVWAPITHLSNTYGDGAVYDVLRPQMYSTAFVNAELLNDQTIMNNPHTAPLYSVFGDGATVDTTNAGRANGNNFICPTGYCVPNLYEVPDGRFALAFNMLAFNPAEGVSGGAYLGNNVITLNLSGAEAFSRGNWRCVVIVTYKAGMHYLGQGQIVWNS